jgi:uncharacterized protein YndB with AHSA1/START domain
MPDTVERSVELAAPPAAVWDALTDGRHLSVWFGADCEIDASPGGQLVVRQDGRVCRAVIVDIEPPHHLGVRWLPDHRPVGFLWSDDDTPAGASGEISFLLTPVEGGTRLDIVETAPYRPVVLASA